MGIWNDIINSKIGEALNKGLEKLFTTTSGVLVVILLLVSGFLLNKNIELLKDAHDRVSPSEHGRVLWKLDSCEVRYDKLKTSYTTDMLVAQKFFSAEIDRRDSILHVKDREIDRMIFIISQYEKTAKQ